MAANPPRPWIFKLRKIEELLAHLMERSPMLVVFHSLGQARRLADRVLVMKDGGIVYTLEGTDLRQRDLPPRLAKEIFSPGYGNPLPASLHSPNFIGKVPADKV